MVKNSNGGKAAKKFARKNLFDGTQSRALRTSECVEELYAVVLKMLGNGRCYVKTVTSLQMLCHIPNKFSGSTKRSNLISLGTVLLVGTRHWENPPKVVDVLSVYDSAEVSMLRKIPTFPAGSLFEGLQGKEEDGIVFSMEENIAPQHQPAAMLTKVDEESEGDEPELCFDDI